MTDQDTDTRFAMTGTPAMSAHVPASSRVFEELRARIIAMTLPPGTRLSRADLAETFGVSQSPIREAMLRLEQVGLVVSYRQSRTEVTYIDRARLHEESFLRTGIECEVINHLAAQGAAADLGKARGILKMQTALADDPDQIALFRELDEDFHRQLFRVAGHEGLHDLVRERSSQMSRLRTLDLPSKGKMQSVIDGHAAILDAIHAGDRHGAVDAMRKHLSGTIDRLPEIVRQYPDCFSR
ncbi:GntR family transcriptional regulator [Chachezhania antarctica]|uniref:GntR family transcriptional regulator n=1 Tax=Chachezhania antarctica TaxID=2340860 RepID=UPI001968C232|nr:GntR family transcriptional regulator [Chachezhania antarctica]